MRALDRFMGPLLLFTFGYVMLFVGAEPLRRGELSMTIQGVPRLASRTQDATLFWGYVGGLLAVGSTLVLLSFASAASVIRMWGSPRLEPSGSRAALRLMALFFIGIIVAVTVQAVRAWAI